MRRWLYMAVALATMMGVCSCNEHTIIPDDTLADIFHDAFLTNAYIDDVNIDIDSLKIYEPIFRRYGYTAEDVRYTIGNFSRRKSVRLGSVVEQAIARLEEENRIYDKQVVILDTIRDVAIRSYTRTVYEDTLIVARRRADSTRLRVVIEPIIYKGSYTISYKAECKDDLDEYPRRAELYFEDEDGIRSSNSLITMRSSLNANRTLVSNREENIRLVLELGNYKDKVRPWKQSLDIRNLKVVYKPNEDVAADSLYRSYIPIKIFVDGFLIKKDSLALSADSTRVDSLAANHR